MPDDFNDEPVETPKNALGYGAVAGEYWAHGWRGVLPLPTRTKVITLTGWSGHDKPYPSWPDVMAWAEEWPDGNLALRLPNTVVGIDVDHYGEKRGGDTLLHAESLWGPLPRTPRSTARQDGISGIRLFRVPAGTALDGGIAFRDLGLGGIDVIQHSHRYCVAWPSLHPTAGRYQWLDADGDITDSIPRPGTLPELPARWITALSRTVEVVTVNGSAAEVLSSLDRSAPSMRVATELAAGRTALLESGESRHDAVMRCVGRLLRMHEQGEPGVGAALVGLERDFVRAITADRSRDGLSARGEFARMLGGQRIHDLIASTPTGPSAQELVGIASLVPTPVPSHPEPVDLDIFDLVGTEVMASNLVESEVCGPVATAEEGRVGSVTSWGPVDLASILSGEIEPEQPTLFKRGNDALLYPGRVNFLVGESESGKSWCAMIAAQQTMMDGGDVFYLDFEDTVRNVVSRFRLLGVPDRVIGRHLLYASPDAALDFDAQAEVAGVLGGAPALAVVDGINAAMTLMGMDLYSNVDATRFHQLVLKPLTRTNAAVLGIDHVTKSTEGRGSYAIGAQAKKAMADGAMIGVRAVERFGRGQLGKLELSVLKDKPGAVRALSERRGQVDYLANVVIDARQTQIVTAVKYESEDEPAGDETSGHNNHTTRMINISQTLDRLERSGFSEIGVNDVVRETPNGGRRKDTLDALHALVQNGCVKVRPGPRNARYHTLVTPFNGHPVNPADRMLMG